MCIKVFEGALAVGEKSDYIIEFAVELVKHNVLWCVVSVGLSLCLCFSNRIESRHITMQESLCGKQ